MHVGNEFILKVRQVQHIFFWMSECTILLFQNRNYREIMFDNQIISTLNLSHLILICSPREEEI